MLHQFSGFLILIKLEQHDDVALSDLTLHIPVNHLLIVDELNTVSLHLVLPKTAVTLANFTGRLISKLFAWCEFRLSPKIRMLLYNLTLHLSTISSSRTSFSPPSLLYSKNRPSDFGAVSFICALHLVSVCIHLSGFFTCTVVTRDSSLIRGAVHSRILLSDCSFRGRFLGTFTNSDELGTAASLESPQVAPLMVTRGLESG